jgi:hypothetical protein
VTAVAAAVTRIAATQAAAIRAARARCSALRARAAAARPRSPSARVARSRSTAATASPTSEVRATAPTNPRRQAKRSPSFRAPFRFPPVDGDSHLSARLLARAFTLVCSLTVPLAIMRNSRRALPSGCVPSRSVDTWLRTSCQMPTRATRGRQFRRHGGPQYGTRAHANCLSAKCKHPTHEIGVGARLGVRSGDGAIQ